jgi:hypothetical protein
MSPVTTIKHKILFSLLITLVWAVFPVLSVFLIFFLIYKLNRQSYSLNYLCLLIAVTIGLIAYTGQWIGTGEPTDLTRYTTQFQTFTEIKTASQFFITAILTDGGVYLVFEFFTLLLAKIFPHNPQVLPFFWVGTAYFFMLLGLTELAQYQKTFSKKIFIILALLCLFGTTFFTLEVELIKQSSSTGIAAYAIFRKLNGKKYCWWIFIAALLVHTSVIIFLPMMWLMEKKVVTKYHLLLIGGALLMSFVDLNKLLSLVGSGGLAEKAAFYAKVSNWQITKINYLMFTLFGLFTLVCVWERSRNKQMDEYRRQLFNVCIMSFCFLVIQFSSIHNFVRYTYLYSPFYVLSFFFLLISSMKRKEKVTIVTAYFAFMVFINFSYLMIYLNSDYTNQYMDNSVVKLLTSNVYMFLKYNAVN